jgi:hypothetical protein
MRNPRDIPVRIETPYEWLNSVDPACSNLIRMIVTPPATATIDE